ncbi:hypothetical protein EIP86_002460 [Pleurotus ostreatoroseus]|nr:hypothetical protein EIP86_002460 [Pleurotus ostreatoroseus]
MHTRTGSTGAIPRDPMRPIATSPQILRCTHSSGQSCFATPRHVACKFLDTLEGVLRLPKTSLVVRKPLLDVLAGAAWMGGEGSGRGRHTSIVTASGITASVCARIVVSTSNHARRAKTGTEAVAQSEALLGAGWRSTRRGGGRSGRTTCRKVETEQRSRKRRKIIKDEDPEFQNTTSAADKERPMAADELEDNDSEVLVESRILIKVYCSRG